MKREITIYTDGSSLGNPGPGGWGTLLLTEKSAVELGGRDDNTTNNKMELQALIEAMKLLAERGITDYDVTIFADSKYVLQGISEWIHGWKKRGWKKADGKPVLNQEYWQELDGLRNFLEEDGNKLFFEHVKAHNGEIYNERVDDIARLLAGKEDVELYSGKRTSYLA